MKQYYVYILASHKNWTIYIWVTWDIIRRIYEHKNWLIEWFTKKYWVKNLVYFEIYNSIENAIIREKQLKAWSRKNKIDLIETNNPTWADLYETIVQ